MPWSRRLLLLFVFAV